MRAIPLACLLAAAALAAPLHGLVRGAGVPLPGATVTVSHGKVAESTVTSAAGRFQFSDLAAGKWAVQVRMTGFVPVTREVIVGPTPVKFVADLRIAPLAAIAKHAAKRSPTVPAAPASASAPATKRVSPGGSSGPLPVFSVNGSMDNSANSPFAVSPAFGNNRPKPNALFNGSFGLVWNTSALDARGFSLTGRDTPQPAYNDATGLFSFGGPLLIPHLDTAYDAPVFFLSYQKEIARNAVTAAALVPTLAERSGDLSALGGPVLAAGRISPQAEALLDFYPLPNLSGSAFNYQIPLISNRHRDSLQSRLGRIRLGQFLLDGSFSLDSTRSGGANIFSFDDTNRTLALQANLTARRAFASRLFASFGVQFHRVRIRLIPFFAGRRNIAAEAGVAGGDDAPESWGPPALSFSNGFAGLSDGNPANLRDQTVGLTTSWDWMHGGHDLSFGGDLRRLEFNGLEQPDPRGSFVFNGVATGNAFEDFLLGLPDTARLVYGDADRHFRQSTFDLYASDDWRAGETLTLDLGARWEYQAPITELNGGMVNLDVAPGFTAVAPVLASRPIGSVSGERYPRSLLRPDTSAIEPRLGLAWQPFAASLATSTSPLASLTLRAGYGTYYDTSVYEAIATRMAEQAPLWQSLSVAASAANPLTLASALTTPAGPTPDLFGIDPNFRVGYVRVWNASVQTDLPASLMLVVSYLGNKGSHGAQLFLPNSFAPGVANPCPACPSGFAYETSNGNSTYESGQVELERRFARGFAATLVYTYASALDDDTLTPGQSSPAAASAATTRSRATAAAGAAESPSGLAGGGYAQNWRDLDGERGPSDFEQRNRLTLAAQYSTGTGLHGGLLMSGWRGPIFRGWTVTASLTAGSGLPLTPVVAAVIGGTGFAGIRPELTGADPGTAPPGRHLNPAAYAVPPAGTWGDAGRNSITGPSVFGLNAGVQRSFPISRGLRANLRVDMDNVLNHVTYPSWDAVVGSAQFGLPLTANPMRVVTTSLRVTF